MSGGFAAGLQFGRGLYNDAERQRLLDSEDQRRQWEFEQRKEGAARDAKARSDLGYIADGGLTGITPNMTTAPGGMGPVADPALVDIRYRGGAPAAPAAPVASPPEGGVALAGTAPPLPPVDPAAPAGVPTRGGMTPAEQTSAIGNVALRAGDSKGFFTAQDRAKAQVKQKAMEDFGHKLITMSDEELAQTAQKWIDKNPNVPGSLKYDPKTHEFSVIHDDGRVSPMNGAQARTLALGAFHMGNGDPEKGLELMFKANNDRFAQQNAAVKDENALTGIVGQQGLRVATENRKFMLDTAHAKQMEASAARQAAAAERAAKAADAGHWAMQPNSVGPNGFVMALDGKTGQTKELTGVKPLRDPTAEGKVTKKELGDFAKSIVDSGQKGTDGKPIQIGEALDMAKDYYEVDPDSRKGLDVDAIAKSLAAAKAAKNGGKTAGGPMPQLGNPGSAQTPAPTQAQPSLDPGTEAQQIRAKLANADANIPWLDKIAGGHFLSVAERMALQRRLAQLEGR